MTLNNPPPHHPPPPLKKKHHWKFQYGFGLLPCKTPSPLKMVIWPSVGWVWLFSGDNTTSLGNTSVGCFKQCCLHKWTGNKQIIITVLTNWSRGKMKQVQHTEKQLISCTHNKKYHLDKKKLGQINKLLTSVKILANHRSHSKQKSLTFVDQQ